ncbi:MAG TPA: diacylglycerol kinase family protein [Mycobacteriales bacterium]|nr:diacylglycerol kinase family protein [Mycobacteriales bacterium]
MEPTPPARHHHPLRARLAAIAALGLLLLAAVSFLIVAINLVDALIVLGCLFLGTYCALLSLTRRGALLLLTIPGLLVALTVLVLVAYDHRVELTIWIACVLLFGLAARAAVRADQTGDRGPTTPPARRGVLLINPRSGDGKAGRVGLAAEAARRGLHTVVLEPGGNLRELVEKAIADGADVVGMAGGDGSQAVVAAVASARGVAHVCVPSGTRNHFAQDLGLDRDDPVGALDAFTAGVERRVDLAAVNGRVFVNNASLGLYASVVQSATYREAKLRTWERMLPDLLGGRTPVSELRFDLPDAGKQNGATLLMVSNNPYDLRRPRVAGSRPRIDSGTLGILSASLRNADEIARFVTLMTIGQEWRMDDIRQWSAATFEVDSTGPVALGIDGEAVQMAPPLRFESRPGALRVRLPATASGLSPSAAAVGMSGRDLRRLVTIAAGR